jgi:RND family efflux transporter MFP subunit
MRAGLAALLVPVLLAACSRPVEKTEEIRPVRAMLLAADTAQMIAEFPGEVRSRVESRLGFRVGGKIIARRVDVGSRVARGQVLMQLDPQDLQLQQAQASAALNAAASNLSLAEAEMGRYRELRQKNFVSQAVLDAKEAAFRTAKASHAQAVAAYRTQSNQAGYAALVSDVDGVVTGIEAEAGQVVAAGTPVVRVAQAGEKEVVIGIPENQVDRLRKVTDLKVRIWANPDSALPGRLRELSPMADPATRTYTAKVAIPDAPPEVRLGMTAYVRFTASTPDAMPRVPLSALRQDKEGSAVWVVENGAVRLVPVQVAGVAGNDILLAGGAVPGQTIVTAGVHQLRSGQKVRILGEQAVASQAASQAGKLAGELAENDGAKK